MSSSLKVRQIRAKLQQMFEPHLDLSDIGLQDAERDNKVLSRCLAAFAIYRETGCTVEEAGQSVWDGGDDNGVDAVYFDVSGSRVVIAQSKWIRAGSGEPSAAEIRSFADGVRDLIEQDSSGFHARIQPKLYAIYTALETVGTTVRLLIATTGKSGLAAHGSRVLNKLVESLNGDDIDEIASWTSVGLAEVYDGLAGNASFGKINLDATVYDWSFFQTPYAAYFGIIDGLQLKLWWQSFGSRLVAKNIRHALGSTDVNNAISHTARYEPDSFWYFNNGITLIADEAQRAPATVGARSAGVFTFNGASIVNGAQTVSTLGRVDEDESLGRVRVPIRVILLKDAPTAFGGEVTRTNNLQNRVEARDFVAQDQEQQRLQKEMAFEDVEYQFLRGEGFVQSAMSTELMEMTTALACASGDPTLAVLAKTAVGRFFSDLKRAPYRTIFNPSLRGARAFNSVVLQREIDRWIEIKKDALDQKKGLAWGLLVHGNRVLAAATFKRLRDFDLQQPIAEFRQGLDIGSLHSALENVFESMVSVLERDHGNRFMAVLFKSPSKSKQVSEDAIDFYGPH